VDSWLTDHLAMTTTGLPRLEPLLSVAPGSWRSPTIRPAPPTAHRCCCCTAPPATSTA